MKRWCWKREKEGEGEGDWERVGEAEGVGESDRDGLGEGKFSGRKSFWFLLVRILYVRVCSSQRLKPRQRK